MGRATPYQPSLLRLLHGVTALVVPLAWLSGLVVLINHDGRWVQLPAVPGDWIDVHGTIGVVLWPVRCCCALCLHSWPGPTAPPGPMLRY